MNNVNLNSFLKFGYFLNYKNPKYKINLSLIKPSLFEGLSLNELVSIGIDKYKNAIINQFDKNKRNLVPLSGGLDSRAILATLLELTEAANIHTYTFGTPGAYDYEIGNKTAKKLGTNHTNFALDNYQFTESELIETAKRFDCQTLLFYHPPLKKIDELYGDCNVWSGAIIDVIFGRHYHKKKADNLNQAIINSFDENAFVKSVCLNNIEQNEYFKYVEYDKNCEGKIAYEHCIDLLNRQLKYIAPQVLYNDISFKVLFIDEELISFAFSIDQKFNEKQFIYKKILLKAFPEFFKMGYSSYNGLSLDSNQLRLGFSEITRKIKTRINRIHQIYLNKHINFFDFNKRLISDDIFKKIIRTCIMDLKNRKIIDWIDFDKIWIDHFNKKQNHSNAILTLASLEIILKAGKEI